MPAEAFEHTQKAEEQVLFETRQKGASIGLGGQRIWVLCATPIK